MVLRKVPHFSLSNEYFSELPEVIDALVEIKKFHLKAKQSDLRLQQVLPYASKEYYGLSGYRQQMSTNFIIKEDTSGILSLVALANEYPTGILRALSRKQKRVAKQKYGLGVIEDVEQEQKEICILRDLLGFHH